MLALYTESATDANGPHLVDTAVDRSFAKSKLGRDFGDGEEALGLHREASHFPFRPNNLGSVPSATVQRSWVP